MAPPRRSRPLDLPALLAATAAAHGDLPAVSVGPGPPLTFGQWWGRARAAAARLRERVRPGETIALPFPARLWPDYCVAYFACQVAGAIPVPCKPAMSPGEWARLATGCGIAHVIAPDGEDCPRPTVDVPVWSYARLLESGADLPGAGAVDEVAHVLFTSGTTGVPKAVAASHAELLSGSALPPAWAGRTMVHSMSPAAAAGTEGAMLLALKSGLHATTVAPVRAAELAAKIADPSVRIVLLTPPVAMMCVREGLFAGTAAHVKLVMLMGSATPEWTLRELSRYFRGGTVMSHYGATEAGAAQLLMPFDPDRPTAVGRAMGDTEVRIVVDDSIAAPGGAGEVLLRRRHVPQRRYVTAAAGPAAASAFADDGWVRTGDLGYLDQDGYLHLLGRKKDIVIRGGQNIAPAEIESALMTHPDVAAAAAFGVPHALWGEMLVAAVVPRGIRPVTALGLRGFLRPRLAAFKIPSRIVVVDSLPRNDGGKVRKDQLRDEYLAREQAHRQAHRQAPAGSGDDRGEPGELAH